MPKEQEEGEGDGEVGRELGVGRGHAVASAIHFYIRVLQLAPTLSFRLVALREKYWGRVICVRGGRCSLINRFNIKFSTSHPNCPRPMSTISTSREDHIRVA